MKYEDINTPEELLNYMDSINYGFVDNNGKIYKDPDSEEWNNNWYTKCIIQDGNSLIETKYGTCWDQVELERKWFSEHNYDFKTYFIWYPDKNLPTHTFLVYKENNKYYWFEHAFSVNRGIHEFNNIDDLFNKVYEEQNKYTNVNYELNRVEYDKPNNNISVSEYLNHVLKKID